MALAAASGRRAPPRGAVVPLATIALLEVAAFLFLGREDYTFAAPHDIVLALGRALADGSLPAATAQTLSCVLAGLAVGFALGVMAGVALGLTPLLDRLTMVSVELLRPVPPAALIPLMLLIAGFGFQMETTIVAFTTLWPTLVLSRAAIRAVEPGLIEVARALEMGTLRRALAIVVPSALLRLFVAFRLTAGIALTVAVVVEVVANPRGLGYGMIVAAQTLHPETALAYLVWIGLLGWGLNALLSRIEARFLDRFR
ncbi:sulfonate transport system permease protein [Rhizobiaceae bacterium]|nr:sulfonate transport system permease protein [Rhizobiaceae bacterium]